MDLLGLQLGVEGGDEGGHLLLHRVFEGDVGNEGVVGMLSQKFHLVLDVFEKEDELRSDLSDQQGFVCVIVGPSGDKVDGGEGSGRLGFQGGLGDMGLGSVRLHSQVFVLNDEGLDL